jgi:hypothetical protein
MVAATEHGPWEGAAPIRTPRVTVAVPHEPHEIDDAGELLAHLVAQHDYSAEQLSGAMRSYLVTAHVRAHHRMAEQAAGRTVRELAGSAERLFATAADTLEAILPLDRELVQRLTGRWRETLNALGR